MVVAGVVFLCMRVRFQTFCDASFWVIFDCQLQLGHLAATHSAMNPLLRSHDLWIAQVHTNPWRAAMEPRGRLLCHPFQDECIRLGAHQQREASQLVMVIAQ